MGWRALWQGSHGPGERVPGPVLTVLMILFQLARAF